MGRLCHGGFLRGPGLSWGRIAVGQLGGKGKIGQWGGGSPPLGRGRVEGAGSLIETEIWCGGVIGEDRSRCEWEWVVDLVGR